MAESYSHWKAKRRSAGFGGQVEVLLPSGRRLDALSWNGVWGTEVEMSGSFERMRLAAERLRESGVPRKVLKVPQRHMRMAAAALRSMGVSAWVRNIPGTKEYFVGCRRS